MWHELFKVGYIYIGPKCIDIIATNIRSQLKIILGIIINFDDPSNFQYPKLS